MESDHYKQLVETVESGKIWKGLLHLPHTSNNEEKLKDLFSSFESYCICREGSESGDVKPHYHFFCFLDGSTIKLSSFKKNIRTKFPELKRPSEKRGGEHLYACDHPKYKNQKQYLNFLSETEQKVEQIAYCCKDWTTDNPSIKKNFKLTKIYKKIYYELKQKNLDQKTSHQKTSQEEKQSYVRILENKITEKFTKTGADGKNYFEKPVTGFSDEIIELVCQHFLKKEKSSRSKI